MESLKKCYNLKANSILESMIALTIISICLSIAIMIFAGVFTSRTSVKFYNTQNKINELFYLAQIKNDSLIYENEDHNLVIDEEILNEGLKKITVQIKDSTEFRLQKNFYVQTKNE